MLLMQLLWPSDVNALTTAFFYLIFLQGCLVIFTATHSPFFLAMTYWQNSFCVVCGNVSLIIFTGFVTVFNAEK